MIYIALHCRDTLISGWVHETLCKRIPRWVVGTDLANFTKNFLPKMDIKRNQIIYLRQNQIFTE